MDSSAPSRSANAASKSCKRLPWSHLLQAFIVQYYLPLIFAVAITLALAWPNPGSHVVHVVVLDNVHIIQEINIGIVFFISGLVLNTDDLYKAKGHVLAVVYGFIAILCVTPCLGFAMREVPLEPQLFTTGLTIYCIVPTTLGIGVALMRMCKGNDGIALLMTVGTNLIGVGTMPLSLKLMFLNYDLTGLSVKIDAMNLLIKLAITALAPSVLGKLMRELWPAARQFAGNYRTALSMVSTTQLAFIVWQTLSGARDLLFQAKARSIVCVIALAASIYLFYLLVNYAVIMTCFNLPTPEAVSVIIMASQKSSPVAITVISYITSNAAEQGLLAMPSVVGQLAQIFIGSLMAAHIAKHVDAYHERVQQQTCHAAATTQQATVEMGHQAARSGQCSEVDKACLQRASSPALAAANFTQHLKSETDLQAVIKDVNGYTKGY